MANLARLSREDYKKSKELEELRKTGAAPPELDEDGRMINPHIPQYVSQSPWYLNNNHPGLKHQYMKSFAPAEKFDSMLDWYDRGVTKGKLSKFKKGACENCGASTHKTKECTDRPRHLNARRTGKVFGAEESVKVVKLDYDGKRDRWNGYDPATYVKIINQHERAETERRAQKAIELRQSYLKKDELSRQRREEKENTRKLKEEKKQARIKRREERAKRNAIREEARKKDPLAFLDEDESSTDKETDTDTDDTDTDTDTDTDAEVDHDHAIDEGMKDDGKVHHSRNMSAKHTTNQTTARNLRIREDTAKYLRNLNPNSAYYDPKTRSMRENPYPDKDPSELIYAGDNFVRKSGESTDVARLQLFVWEANAKGNEDLHVLTNPSQAEHMYEQYLVKRDQLKQARKKEILGKYGGVEHLEAPPPEMIFAQSERYVEYTQTGEVVKGEEEAIPKTKYAEDVLENNHTAIWGSHFENGKWGYACCRALIRNAYCTGSAGVKAALDIKREMGLVGDASRGSNAHGNDGDVKAITHKPSVPLFDDKSLDRAGFELSTKKKQTENEDQDEDEDESGKEKEKEKKQQLTVGADGQPLTEKQLRKLARAEEKAAEREKRRQEKEVRLQAKAERALLRQKRKEELLAEGSKKQKLAPEAVDKGYQGVDAAELEEYRRNRTHTDV